MTADTVMRGEFDMLKQQVSDNAHRLDAIDTGGTRGVAVLQLQITEQSTKVTTLISRFDHHERDHVADVLERQRQRRAAWRWGVATVIAFLAMVEGPLLYLVAAHHR